MKGQVVRHKYGRPGFFSNSGRKGLLLAVALAAATVLPTGAVAGPFAPEVHRALFGRFRLLAVLGDSLPMPDAAFAALCADSEAQFREGAAGHDALFASFRGAPFGPPASTVGGELVSDTGDTSAHSVDSVDSIATPTLKLVTTWPDVRVRAAGRFDPSLLPVALAIAAAPPGEDEDGATYIFGRSGPWQPACVDAVVDSLLGKAATFARRCPVEWPAASD